MNLLELIAYAQEQKDQGSSNILIRDVLRDMGVDKTIIQAILATLT